MSLNLGTFGQHQSPCRQYWELMYCGFRAVIQTDSYYRAVIQTALLSIWYTVQYITQYTYITPPPPPAVLLPIFNYSCVFQSGTEPDLELPDLLSPRSLPPSHLSRLSPPSLLLPSHWLRLSLQLPSHWLRLSPLHRSHWLKSAEAVEHKEQCRIRLLSRGANTLNLLLWSCTFVLS